ncbi:MAG: N,N-dimethylformamidase beta subunit family domain-containing protein [Candidatus Nitrosocosmicus sp.]
MNKNLRVFIGISVIPLIFTIFLIHFFPITLADFKGNSIINNNSGDTRHLVNLSVKITKTNNISRSNYNIPIQDFNKIKIGMVKPTFTDAAYNNKFYSFYVKYTYVSTKINVTKDLNLLNSKISNRQSGTIHNVFAMIHLIKDIKAISNQTQVNVLTDTDVDKGKIFDNQHLNLFDILILGHQEYLTQKEYDNLKQFVSNGGKMFVLGTNVFYAEVKYFGNNNTISLVKGHGWAYNGKSAWKSIGERWKNETKDWVGSNYLCYLCIKTFRNNPFDYSPHEEQYITNPKDIILLNYNPIELPNAPKSNVAIAIYELNYGKGKVIAFGIYSDDIIQNVKFDKYFTDLLVKLSIHPG